MARGIFAGEALAPTPSFPKQGECRKIEPLRVGDRGSLGWEESRLGRSGSNPLRQRTTTSAVLFLKCS